MSVNNIKKLSSVAGASKKTKKMDKNALLKPIKYTKVDEETKKSLKERFDEAITEGFKSFENSEEKPVTRVREIKPKLESGAVESEPIEEPSGTPSEENLGEENSGGEVGGDTEGKEDKNKIGNLNDLFIGLDNIQEEFKNITDMDYVPDEYKIDVPTDLGLGKMDVPEVDEDKVREQITAEEKHSTDKQKESVTKTTESAIEKLLSNIETQKEEHKNTENKINEIYDNYKLTEESESLKRGLARSSIALLALDNIEKSRAEELSSVARSLSAEITATEKEITNLQIELTTALENLDLELSININNKVQKKLEELNDKRKEAIEFNNNVQKLEAEYQTKRAEKLDDAAEFEAIMAKKYQGYADADKDKRMFDLAFSYFNNLNQQTALEQLMDTPELMKYLGTRYYDLYYMIMRKEDSWV